MGALNGSGEWGNLAAGFFARYVDASGKKIAFTAAFNPTLEALIFDEAVPVEWRFLLWLWRYSWGNYSDFAVHEKTDKVPLRQRDAVVHLRVDKQRISECVAYWRALGYLISGTGRALFPAVSGIHPQKIPTSRTNIRRLGEDFRLWWEDHNAADFQAWEVAHTEYFRVIKLRAAAVKEYEASRTSGGPILIEEEENNIKSEDPPPPPLSSLPKTAEEEDCRTPYQKFKACYPAEHFDEPKAKPTFEKKPKAEKRHVLERLQVYLACDRWKDEGGRWIPFASKWLESYDADPPPALKKNGTKASVGINGESDAAREYRERQERIKPQWPTS